MTDFGLKRRYPVESLSLANDLHIPQDVVGVLTNFQLDAIRFLWKHLDGRKSCLFNDGRHMGKRITISALIATLVAHREDVRVLIGCDKDETIVSWIFKLQIFIPSLKFSIFGQKKKKDTDQRISFVNYKQIGTAWKQRIAEEKITLFVIDSGANSTKDLKLGIDPPSSCSVVLISSTDENPPNLQGLFRGSNTQKSRQFKRLRRTNEEHLREFPWMDQHRFKTKFEDWKNGRSTEEILSNVVSKITPLEPPPREPNPEELLPKKEDESKLALKFPSKIVFEETQEMSQLLFETDDDMTPVKQEVIRPMQSNHLLSSMYLRLSQSFASTTTPKQRAKSICSVVQDSPDIFASIIDNEEDEHDDDDDDEPSVPVCDYPLNQRNMKLEKVPEEQMEFDEEEEDTTNGFDKSTPLSLTQRPLDLDIQSQSPIFASSLPKPELPPEKPELLLDETLMVNKSEMFEITTNEVFASKIKVTTSQNHQPIEEEDREQLKFDSPENRIFTTPTRKGSAGNTTPSSTGWLSKRGPNRIRSPEKVLAKKRRSLIKLYANSGSAAGSSTDLDFSSFDDGSTQRWNAC